MAPHTATLPAPASDDTPDPRAALATAVEQAKAADTAVARLKTAFSAAQQEKWTAMSALEAAQTAVAVARAADTEALTAAAQDGRTLAGIPRTAHAAIAVERDAVAVVEAAKEAETAIGAALENAKAELPGAKWRLDASVQETVKPHVATLIEDLRAAVEAMTIARESLVAASECFYPVPEGIQSALALSRLDPRIESVHRPRLDWTNPWPATLARLRTDASTPVPPVVFQEEE